MSKKEFVIFVEYGGLGDHLFFSHLPRIAKRAGYERVLISSQSPFRSADTRKLVWEMNPHVDGFTEERGNYVARFASVEAGTNLLDRIMLEMGLEDGERMHEPELYYVPKVRWDVAGKNVLDTNFISYVGKVPEGALGRYLKGNRIGMDYQLAGREKAADVMEGVLLVGTTDLFDYCDLISSCGRFFCFTSGGATLAAALMKPATAFYGEGQNGLFHHSKLHEYVRLGEAGVAVNVEIVKEVVE